MAAVDINRGSYSCSEEARAAERFLLQSTEKEGRADCQGSHREEAPGMDLPYPQRKSVLPGSGEGGCINKWR